MDIANFTQTGHAGITRSAQSKEAANLQFSTAQISVMLC